LLAAKYCVASQDYRRQILRRFVKLRANPIAKSTDFWPRLVAAPADEMISMSANREFGAEGHDEAAGLQIIERDGLMAEHDARSFNRGVDRVIGGIETQAARWIDSKQELPDQAAIYDYLKKLPSRDTTIVNLGMIASGSSVHSATYHRPYQMHGAIGPACAIALYADDSLTVWSHGQGMFPLHRALAELVGLPPDKVRCIHMEGSGCYGHNGADDAGGDAALLARALPGRPVRVQWMREQEHTLEPYGPAMTTGVTAALDGGGNIISWQYDVWSNTHSTRPGPAGSLLAGLAVASPFPVPPRCPARGRRASAARQLACRRAHPRRRVRSARSPRDVRSG